MKKSVQTKKERSETPPKGSEKTKDAVLMRRHRVMNSPAIRRMPVYFHKLMLLQRAGARYISTSVLANYMSIDPIVARKDCELTGATGYPRIGYKVDELLAAIRNYLGWNEWTRACLIGCGSLGSALVGHEEFREYHLDICEVFDINPSLIGTNVHGHVVRDVHEFCDIVDPAKIPLAILCVPSDVAQDVADMLVTAGVKLIWNFATICLQVPHDVVVQREVLAGSLALLSRKRLLHVNSCVEE